MNKQFPKASKYPHISGKSFSLEPVQYKKKERGKAYTRCRHIEKGQEMDQKERKKRKEWEHKMRKKQGSEMKVKKRGCLMLCPLPHFGSAHLLH